MPDANKENTINQLVGAAFGAAGQRCMALSTAIFVGESQEWLPELVERSKSLRVNAGNFLKKRKKNIYSLSHWFSVVFNQLWLWSCSQVISPVQTWGP